MSGQNVLDKCEARCCYGVAFWASSADPSADRVNRKARFQGLSVMERAGFEPATFGLQSRGRDVDGRARTTLNARNHAGLPGLWPARAAWLRGRVPGRLGAE